MSDEKSKVTDKAGEIAKNIWLAGVGAYGRAVDEAQSSLRKATPQPPKLFRDLVIIFIIGIFPLKLPAEPMTEVTELKLFTLIAPEQTNIFFNNEIVDREEHSILLYSPAIIFHITITHFPLHPRSTMGIILVDPKEIYDTPGIRHINLCSHDVPCVSIL